MCGYSVLWNHGFYLFLVIVDNGCIKLVILGFIIAIPISWFAMNQWLADFAYRIEIGLVIFALQELLH
jgi:putative ABC transport system permease protein